MAMYFDDAMKGVCEVCGGKAKTRCTKCKSTYFCSRECQRKAQAFHKKECAIEGAIASCLDANTKNPIILASRSRRRSCEATCMICLEGESDSDETLFHQGCGCRGTSGYAHTRCVFEHAKQKHLMSIEDCPTCTQTYSGEFLLRLAAAWWRQNRRKDVAAWVRERGSDLGQKLFYEFERWRVTNHIIAETLQLMGCHEACTSLRLVAVAVVKEYDGPDSPQYYSELTALATSLARSGEAREALEILEPHGMAWLKSPQVSLEVEPDAIEYLRTETPQVTQQKLERVTKYENIKLCVCYARILSCVGQAPRAEVILKLILADVSFKDDRYNVDLRNSVEQGLSEVLDHRGKYRESFQVLDPLVDRLTRKLGPEHSYVKQMQHARQTILLKIQNPPR